MIITIMDAGKERKGEKESAGGNTSSKDKSSRSDRSNWSVMAVKAKVTDKCLWSACKAMTAGFLFIAVGAGMATLGFYSDHLSTVEQTKGNITVWVKNESKDNHLGSLTYLGPVVMGIGGFTIVAACVMTFEARDTAAKIVPIWFRRTRIHVVSGGSGSTPSGRSSKTSWERFLSQQRPSEDAADTRSAVTQALVNFSKYLQNSIDTNKMPQHNPYVSNQQVTGLRKCPSEPSLGKVLRDANGNNLPESVALLEASTPQPSQRTTYGGGLKTIITRPSKPQLLSVAPDTYRQTVSMDCPRMSRLNDDEKTDTVIEDTNDTMEEKSDRIRVQTLPFQTSCTTSSSGSMSVDIYLPQGAVTLKIHDDMKENKKSPVKLCDSRESGGYKLGHSDMHSFADEDEFSNTDLDDSVFINQDSSFSTPQIILNMLDSNSDQKDLNALNNPLMTASVADKPNVEEWSNYPPAFTQAENKSESLDVHSTDGSPQSLSLSTQFSFEGSDKDSTGASIASVISNPLSSRLCDQRSLSQTDTSFINVSSLGSMESSQDIASPLLFSGSQFFDYHQESLSNDPSNNENYPNISNERTNRMEKKNHSLPEPAQEGSFSNKKENVCKTNPQKHSSLESAEIKISKSKQHTSGSPKRQQVSFEGSERATPDPFLLPSPRYLSPGATSGLTSPTTHSPALSFSPRKTRSESLPERRQAPSLKRFPLLRQVALDAFAEEGSSTHRLDRSQTQISPKETFFPDL